MVGSQYMQFESEFQAIDNVCLFFLILYKHNHTILI